MYDTTKAKKKINSSYILRRRFHVLFYSSSIIASLRFGLNTISIYTNSTLYFLNKRLTLFIRKIILLDLCLVFHSY